MINIINELVKIINLLISLFKTGAKKPFISVINQKARKTYPKISHLLTDNKEYNLKNKIKYFALAYGFKPELIAGLVGVESGYNNHAQSGAGAFGLMQITRRWHPLFFNNGSWDNPDYNLNYGCKVLKSYIKFVKSKGVKDSDALKVALAYYNTGQSAIDSYRAGRNPDETTDFKSYADDVFSYAELIRLQGVY